MYRVNIADAEHDFVNLVDRVYSEGIGIELQRGGHVVAYLTPALPKSPLKVRDLNSFLENLPKLGEDAAAFAADVRTIRRELPAEVNHDILFARRQAREREHHQQDLVPSFACACLIYNYLLHCITTIPLAP